MGHGQPGQQVTGCQQKNGFQGLNPGGGHHPSQNHIHNHETSHDQDTQRIRNAEQYFAQCTGGNHLRYQVGQADNKYRHGDCGTYRFLVEPVGNDVDESVFA